MQKIVLFVEPSYQSFWKSANIGDIFMNRFAIDENASCEILKSFELGKTAVEISWSFGEVLAEERKKKGMDHFFITANEKI